jgi:imidazole glycerol-phosphate synthase subunit HisH
VASIVGIVDYGMGNLDSVTRAVYECGGNPAVVRDPSELSAAAAVILPGVGAFTKGMENIAARGFDRALLDDVVAEGVPLLGLCLGMQLLATRGDEGQGAAGLGVIPGGVVRIQPGGDLRVPHVGWNEVHFRRPSRLFEGVADGCDFYFVHSFHFVPENDDGIVAVTPYGSPLVAAVERENVYGVQFHPEKSQRAGFALVRNFLALAGCNSAHEAPPIGFTAPRR